MWWVESEAAKEKKNGMKGELMEFDWCSCRTSIERPTKLCCSLLLLLMLTMMDDDDGCCSS